MTVLNFSVGYDALINETKCQTIRFNADRWIKLLERNQKLDMWWLSPRNRNPDCKKLGIAMGTATPLYGHEITLAIARDDGYDSLTDLVDVLMELHSVEREDVLAHRWAVIRWTWIKRYWLDDEAFKTTIQTTL